MVLLQKPYLTAHYLKCTLDFNKSVTAFGLVDSKSPRFSLLIKPKPFIVLNYSIPAKLLGDCSTPVAPARLCQLDRHKSVEFSFGIYLPLVAENIRLSTVNNLGIAAAM